MVVALTALVAAMTALYLHYALRVAFFQNDENLYMEQARYVAAHFPEALFQSGVYPRGPQRLDAWIMAIPFALMRGPRAFQYAHALQALMFASTAIPVFLLARGAALGRAGSLLAAAIAVLVPWAIVSTSYLAESAAYPAFGWVLYLSWRVVARPSWRGEAMLVVAIVLAVLARTAMLTLIPLAPVAALWQEWRYGVPGGALRARARDLGPRMWSGHRLISVAIVLGALLLMANALGGLPGRGIGAAAGGYGVPQIELSGLLERYRDYLSRMVTGTGYMSVVIGLPWMVMTLVRPRSRATHAMAVVCLLALLAVLTTLLNAGPDERYLVYTAVPFALLAAASLVEAAQARRWTPAQAALTLACAAGVIALILSTTWPPLTSVYDFFTYPSAIFFQRAILEHFHIGRLSVVAALGAVAVAWTVIRMTGRLVRTATVVLAAGILAACLSQLLYSAKKFTDRVGADGPFASQRSWVDEKVPANAQVGALALSMGAGADYVPIWRETEFWNTSVTKDVMFQSTGAMPTPLGSELIQLTIEPSGMLIAHGGAGLVKVRPVPRYLLIPEQGTNALGLNGRVIGVSSYVPLELVRLSSPAEIRWTVGGDNEEGFVTPGGLVTATVYPAALTTDSANCASFSLLAPTGFKGRVPFRVIGGGRLLRRGTLEAGQTLALKVPLDPVPGAGGPHATISVQMLPGASFPTGTPVQARIAFFEAAPCASTH